MVLLGSRSPLPGAPDEPEVSLLLSSDDRGEESRHARFTGREEEDTLSDASELDISDVLCERIRKEVREELQVFLAKWRGGGPAPQSDGPALLHQRSMAPRSAGARPDVSASEFPNLQPPGIIGGLRRGSCIQAPAGGGHAFTGGGPRIAEFDSAAGPEGRFNLDSVDEYGGETSPKESVDAWVSEAATAILPTVAGPLPPMPRVPTCPSPSPPSPDSPRSPKKMAELVRTPKRWISLRSQFSMKASRHSAIDDFKHCMHGARSRTKRFVQSTVFDTAIGTLLVLNAVSIGLQTDQRARGTMTADVLYGYRVVELIFCVAFSIEVSLRLFVHGVRYVFMPGWQWNIFDCAVVLLQVVEEIVSAIAGPAMEGLDNNIILFRFLRVVRLMRVVRFLRFLRIVSELHVLVCSIAASLRSFFWTAVLLSVMMYVVGVFFTQMVLEFRDSSPEEYSQIEDIGTYWGSLGSSVLSLFQSMSGGIDWQAAMDPLRESHGAWMALVYSFYIAFATLVMLNLVTGIFVQSAQENIRFSKDMELVNRVHELFHSSDYNKSGAISWEEFEKQLSSPHMAQYLKAVDLHQSEAGLLFSLLDVEGNGEVSSDDFVNGCLRLSGNARAVDQAVTSHNSRATTKWMFEHLGLVEEQLTVITEKLSPKSAGDPSSSQKDSASSPLRSDSVRKLNQVDLDEVVANPRSASKRSKGWA